MQDASDTLSKFIHNLKSAQGFKRLGAPYRLARMVVHGSSVALKPLGVANRLHFRLDRLVQDLAISLAQPIAVRVDTLLTGFTVLPYLITLRHPRHAQPVGQDRLDIGLVWQAIGEAHP